MFLVYKQPGELLSELLDRVRERERLDKDVPLTYAGRLDPLAEGVMIILAGEEVHQKERYTKLRKQYTFDILLGVGTDTHDALGRIEQVLPFEDPEERIRSEAETFLGVTEQRYPAYSSKTINGTPLFALARAGNVPDHPTHAVEMFALRCLGKRKVLGGVLADEAQEKVSAVSGDFRQSETVSDWRNFGEEYQSVEFVITRFVATVGSGFYIRQYAHDLGERLGVPALAWWIRRDAVEDYTIEGYGN